MGLGFIAAAIYAIILLTTKQYQNMENMYGDIIGLSLSSIFALLILLLTGIITERYVTIRDVYTEERMYQLKKGVVIFEIKYENIEQIREGLFGYLFISCSSPYKNKGFNKGAKTYAGVYANTNLEQIKKILLEHCPNLKNKMKN